MPTLKLTYFDIHGGRGEPARLAMHIGGVDFEDDRITFQQFGERKSRFPFARVPVLEVDGIKLSQCNAINRYVGTLAGLYPTDPLEAASCDEAMDAVEDIVSKVATTFSMSDDDEKKAARKALADGPITVYLQQLEALLSSRGGEYFADGRLTVADLKVLVWIRNLRSGILDHIPRDLPDRVAPLLVEHLHRIESTPKVREYYERFS
jgi:glutathione S-transferase